MYWARSIVVPIRDGGERYNELTSIWEDWQIAVAVKIGHGPRSGAVPMLYFAVKRSRGPENGSEGTVYMMESGIAMSTTPLRSSWGFMLTPKSRRRRK